jgi:pimeloyl-ACP methyl ester carboxylesterase
MANWINRANQSSTVTSGGARSHSAHSSRGPKMTDRLQPLVAASSDRLDRRSFLTGSLATGVGLSAASLLDRQADAAPGRGVTLRPAPIAGIEPFDLAIPERDLDDLRTRLGRTRWPEPATLGGWTQGANLASIQSLCDYWRTQYDWRRCENLLNGFGQYRTQIDGLGIHFLHVRSPVEDALPLIMTHGWPGSVIEFHKVIGPLTDPAAHGGDPRDAFHVVAPSLPGFGFSNKPTGPGWNSGRIADAWIELMMRLGYGKRWAAQGGDWGALVVKDIAGRNPAGCVGIHANRLFMRPTPEEIRNASPEELRYIASAEKYDSDLSGYAKEQATRPQTLGYSLADSPAGQAAWIYEKYQAWSDNSGAPESIFTRDEMLDNIMLYWLTNSSASSARLYWESARHLNDIPPTRIPIAFSQYPKDNGGASQRWAKARFETLMYWFEADRGGHFAAFEQPQIFTRDVRNGLRSVRGS